ncbi:MAG: SDR family oxidoreductase [Truepera sp.]|nr:SDR family oxidoreductase [Truepera sp.]
MAGTDGRMEGKLVLITGATSGIGEVTARVLAEQGAQVVFTARDRAKAERVRCEIRTAAGHDRVEFLMGDFSSQRQIRRLAEEYRDRFDRLDVLVNNVGAYFSSRAETEDGLERTFAVNHLGYFLLTELLLDLLIGNAPARVVNVASAAHRGASIRFSDLQLKRSYGGWRAYGQSKLANLLFTFELARRLEGTGVTANALHPGFVKTDFGADAIDRIIRWTLMQFAISAERGARTSIYLAASPEVEGVSGKYFVNCKPVEPYKAAHDLEIAGRLWEVSAELVARSAGDGD